MTKQRFSVIFGLTVLVFTSSVHAVPKMKIELFSVPNNRQDNYQYYGANKGGDCSGAKVENSFVVGNRSGIVIYYDLTAPKFRRIDYHAATDKATLWCRFRKDEKNLIDFDFDVDEEGIQMRSYFLKPGKYYYFVLEGSHIKLKSKQLKSIVYRRRGDWDYEVE
jgi:hypothetical protein